MTFFYDLNKRLAAIGAKQKIDESIGSTSGFLEGSTGDYSAKKARAGKDIGKPGKMFSKIAKSAGERYGSKERGEKVAGAVLAKLRAKEAIDPSLEEADDHKETKLIRDLRAKGLSDKEIIRKMKELKYGTTKTVAKEADMDESALQAYLGKKKYGETGMKALQKAGREHAGKAKMDRIRAQYDKMDEEETDEGNAFTAKLKSTPKGGEFELGGKKFKDTSNIEEKKEPRSKGTAFDPEVAKTMFSKEKDKTRTGHEVKDTGYSKRYTKQLSDDPEADDEKSDKPKVKGRPKGSKRAIGAKGPTGKSKLMKKDAIKEMDIALIDKGEYDREGEMAKQQIHTIMRAAKNLHKMLGDDDNLPEWVQKKITLATNYIDSVSDYMASQRAEAGMEQPIAEKAVSQQQQKFMGMVHAMQKGEKIPGASKELKKVAREMPKKAAKDYAATKHAGLPKKVKEAGKPDFLDLDKDGNKSEPMKQAAKQAKGKGKEEADESVEAPKETKSKGGFQFGKGVYESMDSKFKQALTEGMNVSVNMSTDAQGQPSKNITVSADGDDAEALASLLKMAGLGGSGETCPSCGKSGCGCEELDENSPDWPTNTETSDDAFQYSGGLNGPKDSGQSTDAPPNLDPRRQGYVKETVDLERSLFRLYQNYKAQ